MPWFSRSTLLVKPCVTSVCDVEAFDKGAVVAVQDLQQELDCGVLLELKALANGAAGVEHDADAERQIGLLGEARTASGGRRSSSRPKFSRCRPVMKRPFLSVTVKMRLTSLTWTLMVVIGSSVDWRLVVDCGCCGRLGCSRRRRLGVAVAAGCWLAEGWRQVWRGRRLRLRV